MLSRCFHFGVFEIFVSSLFLLVLFAFWECRYSALYNSEADSQEEDYNALRAEITRLKKELRQEKMRAEALDTMIDVAEEMFNIPVRKKAGTKQ